MNNDPYSPDFSCKKYSLKQLEEWVNDALNCEDLTPQEIYDAITKSVKENIEYYQKELDKSKELLSLMTDSKESNITYGTYADWADFWEENYCPEEFKQYTEDELDAMCDAAAEQEERDRCREYNLREAEYYNQRALIDAKYENHKKELEEIRAEGGFEWTPESKQSKYYYDTDRNK